MTQSKLPSFLVAIWLLGTIATNSRVSEFLQSLQEYEIVYPRIIPDGRKRERRSILDRQTFDERFEESVFIEISNWTIRTVSNDRLMIASNFTIDWLHPSEIEEVKTNCELRRGSLEGEDDSLAVVTICQEDVYALILIQGKLFLVQPLMDQRHVMYRSSHRGWWSFKENSNIVSVKRGNSAEKSRLSKVKERKRRSKRKRRDSGNHRHIQGFYNLSGDVFNMEYPETEKLIFYDERDETLLEYNDTIMEKLVVDANSAEIGYFSGPSWQRATASRKKVNNKELQPRWLKLGVAADYSLIDFHGIRVQHYIMALLNIVSAIYMDPSLESNMILVIVRMILYAEKRDGMVCRGNARQSLENVNRWNRKMLSSVDVRHDVAVWLTRLDIGGPSGYAPVSGVCDPSRSCALNQDEGLTSAFIIAHEIAHILGLTHDGDESAGNTCKEESFRGSVMAPMVAATFHHFYWSTCSKNEFHRRVRRWSCLLNKPKYEGPKETKAALLETFTMDDQCRMEFGEGYGYCRTFDVAEPCSRLWCGNINISKTCKTKKGPPLEGTLCGVSKWCVNGRCQSTGRKKLDLGIVLNKPRDGGWSAWSDWEKCSRTCGIGVQCRRRKCNKPIPVYGGKYCSGPSDDCKLCDLPRCSVPVDLRAQQCSRLTDVLRLERIQSKKYATWLPYEPIQQNLKCQLVCKSKETGEIFYTKRNVIDGTPCSYSSTDICIQGECQQMGCDDILGSKKAFDMCGVCDGDNSNCDRITSKFQRKLRREITRLAVIPREAHNLSMNITLLSLPLSNQDNFTIMIGDGRRRRNMQKASATRKGNLIIVQGTAFRVQKRNNSVYSVKAEGTVFEDAVILLVTQQSLAEQAALVAVSLKYFLNRDQRNAKGRYAWLFGGWSFCSTSCGNGTRQKIIVCKDERTGRIVSRRKCSLTTKPSREIEKCGGFSCKFKWLPGPWETCSTTCGNFGMQLRQLYCVRSEFNGTEVNRNNELEVYKMMVQPSMCKSAPMLVNARECNRISCPKL